MLVIGRANAAVKIQSGKATTVEAPILHVLARYYAHSVFLPKQESSKFVLKTTQFTTPLFSINDHLLRSSVVIFLKILGRFNAELMPCQKVLKMTCGRCAVFAESASFGRLHSFSSS